MRVNLIQPNKKQIAHGHDLLVQIKDESVPLVFFDPQYRSVLDKMKYGNEGERESARAALPAMDEDTISSFIYQIDRILIPSGHLMLWVDKFLLVTGKYKDWLQPSLLNIVDMVTWNKERWGMGYRTRRLSEHLIIIQKDPKRAKGVWKNHSIPDVFNEPKLYNKHPHGKPVHLQSELIQAVTEKGDTVVDPAAGSYSVLMACQCTERNFLGCDVVEHKEN